MCNLEKRKTGKKDYIRQTEKQKLMQRMFITFLTAGISFYVLAPVIMACAAGEDKTVLQLILKLAGIGVMVLGGVTGIFGIVKYAEAKGEDNGPNETKGKNQIAAGVFVLALGILLKAADSTNNVIGEIVSKLFTT